MKPIYPIAILDFVSGMLEPLLKSKKVKFITQLVDHLEMPTALLRKNKDVDRLLIMEPKESRQVSMPPVLLGDDRRIRQVLINLVKNAQKFTLEGEIELLMSYDSAH